LCDERFRGKRQFAGLLICVIDRLRKGITAEDFAEILDVSDYKHVSAIEAQRCSVTMERAIRAAYGLGAVIVELEGVGQAVVTPFCVEGNSREFVSSDVMRPGEAAWNVEEEALEALECVKRLQKQSALATARSSCCYASRSSVILVMLLICWLNLSTR